MGLRGSCGKISKLGDLEIKAKISFGKRLGYYCK